MKIFITRKLAKDSPFLSALEAHSISVTGISLISFFPLPFKPIGEVDWIFFYSKKSVRYFLESLGRPLSNDILLAAIGEGTKRAIEDNSYKVSFVGTGKPKETAPAFLKVAMGKKVAFPRAKLSKQSIQKLLHNQIEIIDRVVYANQPVQNCLLPYHDVLVFTSPLNATTYFQFNDYKPTQTIHSIGTSTTEALLKLGISEVITAPSPSELALAERVLQHYRTG